MTLCVTKGDWFFTMFVVLVLGFSLGHLLTRLAIKWDSKQNGRLRR